eukprot:8304850-Lingulodinium_polyedra.AAC.1
MLVYPTASVAMLCLRPRPIRGKQKRALHADNIGMDVDAVGMAARSLMHRKSEMLVSAQRNERLDAD